MTNDNQPITTCPVTWGSHMCLKHSHTGPFHKCNCGNWVLQILRWNDEYYDAPPPFVGIDKQGYAWNLHNV